MQLMHVAGTIACRMSGALNLRRVFVRAEEYEESCSTSGSASSGDLSAVPNLHSRNNCRPQPQPTHGQFHFIRFMCPRSTLCFSIKYKFAYEIFTKNECELKCAYLTGRKLIDVGLQLSETCFRSKY